MATAKQIPSAEEAKQTNLNAIVDRAVAILAPTLDAMSTEEEQAFLHKLANLPPTKKSSGTRRIL